MASNPTLDPEGVGQRAALAPQLGVRDRHLEGGGQHAVDRRAPEDPRHLGTEGQPAAPRPAGLAQAGHTPLDRSPLHLVERRIDGGAAGERGALAPSLALLGDHVHEEERAQGVHAGTGRNVRAKGDVHPDQLDAAEPQRTGAPTPATVDRSLYAGAFSPGWRNGRRGGLKSRCPKGRAGSSPAPGSVRPAQPMQLPPGTGRTVTSRSQGVVMTRLLDDQTRTVLQVIDHAERTKPPLTEAEYRAFSLSRRPTWATADAACDPASTLASTLLRSMVIFPFLVLTEDPSEDPVSTATNCLEEARLTVIHSCSNLGDCTTLRVVA